MYFDLVNMNMIFFFAASHIFKFATFQITAIFKKEYLPLPETMTTQA